MKKELLKGCQESIEKEGKRRNEQNSIQLFGEEFEVFVKNRKEKNRKHFIDSFKRMIHILEEQPEKINVYTERMIFSLKKQIDSLENLKDKIQ